MVELVGQAHADLPLATPVGRPLPELPDGGLGERHMLRIRQIVVVRGSGLSGYFEGVVKPVSLPWELSHDGAFLRFATSTPVGPGPFSGTRFSPSGRKPPP